MTMSEDVEREQQQDLDEVKAAIIGETPLMAQPPDGSVTLFRGLFHGLGWQTDAEVSELTGEDEEIIARAMSSDNTLGYVNAILLQGVHRIGPLVLEELPTHERVGTIDRLLLGEKELLFIRILQITYGDERTVVTECPSCRETIDVSFSIADDIPIRDLDDPQRPSYDFALRDGSHVEYHLVTGEDQAEANKRKGMTTPERNTITLSRCIVSHDGKPLVDPLRFARQLSAYDRRTLLNEISNKQPGPYFREVKLPCAACGVISSFMPTWADLL